MKRIFDYGGFTYIELLIVVAIILILTAVAVPGYTAMRQRAKMGVCIANLKQIDGAIERWSLLADVNENVRLRNYEDEIYALLQGGKPTCPSGGRYTLTRLGQHPQVRCNISGHELLQ